MVSVALAIPIKPGKTDDWKRFVGELMGRRREEYDADQRRFSVQREVAWLQQTSSGDMAILYWEVGDFDLFRQQLPTIMRSEEEFHVWNREKLIDIFGLDPGQRPMELPELVVDSRMVCERAHERNQKMESVAFAIPIKPGKAEAWKQYVAELSGRWRNEYEASKREFGIRREAAWLQRTPDGDLAILYREVEDPDRASQELSEVKNSDEEFYTWKRNNYREIFGMDPSQPIPEMPELVVDQRL